MVLRNDVIWRLPARGRSVVEGNGELVEWRDDLMDKLVDGAVLDALGDWYGVQEDLDEARYRLRIRLGDSVADDPGDERGVYIFPYGSAPEIREHDSCAALLERLERAAVGRWVQPMTSQEAQLFRPPPRTSRIQREQPARARKHTWTRDRFRPR